MLYVGSWALWAAPDSHVDVCPADTASFLQPQEESRPGLGLEGLNGESNGE